MFVHVKNRHPVPVPAGAAEEARAAVIKGARWADVIAAGPGIGTGECGLAITKAVLAQTDKTVILDADALNCASIFGLRFLDHPKLIITPHMGEMSRLCGLPVGELKADAFAAAAIFARANGCVTVLKDARTVIALPDGTVFAERYGGSGLATAGSGDVLTGITAGTAARGCAFERIARARASCTEWPGRKLKMNSVLLICAPAISRKH